MTPWPQLEQQYRSKGMSPEMLEAIKEMWFSEFAQTPEWQGLDYDTQRQTYERFFPPPVDIADPAQRIGSTEPPEPPDGRSWWERATDAVAEGFGQFPGGIILNNPYDVLTKHVPWIEPFLTAEEPGWADIAITPQNLFIPQAAPLARAQTSGLAGMAGSLASGAEELRTLAERGLGTEIPGQEWLQQGSADAARLMEMMQRKQTRQEPVERVSQAFTSPIHTMLTGIEQSGPTVAMALPALAGGAAIQAAGAAPIVAQTLAGVLGAGVESLMEAGDALERARAAGLSEEEARRVSDQVGKENFPLLAATTPIEIIAAMNPLTKTAGGRLLARTISKLPLPLLRNLTTGAIKTMAIGALEGKQELYQQRIQEAAMSGQPIDWDLIAKTPEERQAETLGALMGGVFGAAGAVPDIAQNTLRDQAVRMEEETARRLQEANAAAVEPTAEPEITPDAYEGYTPEEIAAMEAAAQQRGVPVDQVVEETNAYRRGESPAPEWVTTTVLQQQGGIGVPTGEETATPVQRYRRTNQGWMPMEAPTVAAGPQPTFVTPSGPATATTEPLPAPVVTGTPVGVAPAGPIPVQTPSEATSTATTQPPAWTTGQAGPVSTTGVTTGTPITGEMVRPEVPRQRTVIDKIKAQERFQAEKLRAAGRIEEADFVAQRAEQIREVPEAELTGDDPEIAKAVKRYGFKPVFIAGAVTAPGFYEQKTVVVNTGGTKEQAASAIAVHELTHGLKDVDAEAHAGLSAIIKELAPDLWTESETQARQSYAGVYKGTPEQLEALIQEETLGNVAQRNAAAVWQAIADRTSMESAAQPKGWQKVVAHVRRVMTKLAKAGLIPQTMVPKNRQQVAQVALQIADALRRLEVSPTARSQTPQDAPGSIFGGESVGGDAQRAEMRPRGQETLLEPELVESPGEEVEGEPGRFAIAEVPKAPIFYSKLDRAIEERMPRAARADQVRGILKSAGIKQEEVEWRRVEQFLKANADRAITKEEMREFLQGEQIQVEEIIKTSEETNLGGTYHQQRGMSQFDQWQLPGGSDYRELLFRWDNPDEVTTFRGQHWTEGGIFAHVRFNERTDAQGRRVLFIEEIQSDWHQAGREKGHRRKPTFEEFKSQRDLNDETARLVYEDVYGDQPTMSDTSRYPGIGEIPNAPFKTTWPDLVLKRMFRWAAENGFDRVAFTTGRQQAERYNLAKKASKIAYSPATEEDPTSHLVVYDHGGSIIIHQRGLNDEDLQRFVGKELAVRLLSSPMQRERIAAGYEPQAHILQGDDLAFGGEGMQTFYDRMIPSTVEKLGKKWGVKVSTEEMEFPPEVGPPEYVGPSVTPQQLDALADRYPLASWVSEKMTEQGIDFATALKTLPITFEQMQRLAHLAGGKLGRLNRSEPVHVFDVTPQMREEVLNVGQPMFAIRDLPATWKKDYNDRAYYRALPRNPNIEIVPNVDGVELVYNDERGELAGTLSIERTRTQNGFAAWQVETEPDVRHNSYGLELLEEAARWAGGPLREIRSIPSSDTVIETPEDILTGEPAKTETRSDGGEGFLVRASQYREDLVDIPSLKTQYEERGMDWDATSERLLAAKPLDRAKVRKGRPTDRGGEASAATPRREDAGLRGPTEGEGPRVRRDETTQRGPGEEPEGGEGGERFAIATPAGAIPSGQLKQSVWYEWANRHLSQRFERLGTAMRQIAGQEWLPQGMDFWHRAQAMLALTSAGMRKFSTDFLTPLVDEMKASKVKLDELGKWLYLRHYKERDRVLKERWYDNPRAILVKKEASATGKKKTDLQKKIADLDADEKAGKFDGLSGLDEETAKKWHTELDPKARELTKLEGRIRDIVKEQRRMIRAYGLEADEKILGWESMFQHYVPLKDIEERDSFMDELLGGERRREGSGGTKGPMFKHAIGRKTLSDPEAIIPQLFSDTFAVIERGEKNEVYKRLLVFAEQYKDAKGVDGEPLFKKIKAVWKDTVEMTEEGPVIRQRRDMLKEQLSEGRLPIRYKGQQWYLQINDKEMIRALETFSPESAGKMVQALGKLTRLFSRLQTTWNPLFMLTNTPRDWMTANLQLLREEIDGVQLSKIKGLRSQFNKHFVSAIARGKGWDQWVKEWEEDGGQIGFWEPTDVERMMKNFQRQLADVGDNPARASVRKAIVVGQMLESLNSRFENASRLAIYRTLREAGVERRKAGQLSRKITVDFNQKGRWGTSMGRLWAFANANMQGAEQLARAIATNPKVQVFAASTMALGYLYARMMAETLGPDPDEPDKTLWENLPDDSKERFILIPNGKGGFYRVPLPYGFNVFWVAGVLAYDSIHSDRHPADSAMRYLVNMMSPFNPLGNVGTKATPQETAATAIIPTAFRPMAEAYWLNQDWRGAPIAPTPFVRQPYKIADSGQYWARSKGAPMQQATEWLNRFAGGTPVSPGRKYGETVGDLMDWNPEKLEYVLGSFLGGAGRLVEKIFTLGRKYVTSEPRNYWDYPVVSTFYQERPTWVLDAHYNEYQAEVERIHDELQYWQKEKGKTAPEATYYRQQWKPYLDLYDDIRRFREALKRAKTDEQKRELKKKFVAKYEAASRKVGGE